MNDIALLLRALQLYAHNAHNLITGPSFFPDHEFLGELYAAYETAYDNVIERMIGLGGIPLDLVSLQSDAAALLAKMTDGSTDPRTAFEVLLKSEKALCSELSVESGSAVTTIGTQNLLAQLADDSEARQYKLQRRLA